MDNIPYGFLVGSLMYFQTCTRSDISFSVSMLGRYESNPRLHHYRVAKKILRYLHGTKDHTCSHIEEIVTLRLLVSQIQTMSDVRIPESPHLTICFF